MSNQTPPPPARAALRVLDEVLGGAESKTDPAG